VEFGDHLARRGRESVAPDETAEGYTEVVVAMRTDSIPYAAVDKGRIR